jgi:hypothetical protein
MSAIVGNGSSSMTHDPLRFETLRIGTFSMMVQGFGTISHEARVLLCSDGTYRVLGGAMSPPLPSIEAAVALVGKSADPSVEITDVTWRAPGEPLREGEHACPVCSAPAHGGPRYPRALCYTCVLEATDARGRALIFSNIDSSGGFQALYADDETPHAGHVCFVRGRRMCADERVIGGIVVQPVD